MHACLCTTEKAAWDTLPQLSEQHVTIPGTIRRNGSNSGRLYSLSGENGQPLENAGAPYLHVELQEFVLVTSGTSPKFCEVSYFRTTQLQCYFKLGAAAFSRGSRRVKPCEDKCRTSAGKQTRY